MVNVCLSCWRIIAFFNFLVQVQKGKPGMDESVSGVAGSAKLILMMIGRLDGCTGFKRKGGY